MTSKIARTLEISTIWGLYFSTFVIFLYFERVVFSEHFKDEMDYLLFGGFVLFACIGTATISNFLPTRILSLITFLSAIINAGLWFIVGYNLPFEEAEMGCDALICGQTGQILLGVFMESVTLPLLIEWTSRIETNDSGGSIKLAGAISGIVLLIGGILVKWGYFWSIIINAPIFALIALAILASSMNCKFSSHKSARKEATRVNLLRAFRNFALILLFSVLGFSTLEDNNYSYGLLTGFGLGILIFQGIKVALDRLVGERKSLLTLEGMVFLLFLVAIAMIANLFSYITEISFDIGIPVIIIGFTYGHIINKVTFSASGKKLPDSRFAIPFKGVSTTGLNKFSTTFFLALILVLNVVRITIDYNQDTFLLLLAGELIAGIFFIMWLIHIFKIKKKLIKIEKTEIR
ncbi:MAG: hypothetical protein ACFFCS_15500 [Candidatus Hodarchaeota archaeon]